MAPQAKALRRWKILMLVLVTGSFVGLTACDWFKPAMPIEITYRESLVGQGYVLQFHNTSPHLLRVAVSITDSATGTSKEQSLEISAGQTAEIGWLEGWKFVSGDRVTVRHEDHAELTYQIP